MLILSATSSNVAFCAHVSCVTRRPGGQGEMLVPAYTCGGLSLYMTSMTWRATSSRPYHERQRLNPLPHVVQPRLGVVPQINFGSKMESVFNVLELQALTPSAVSPGCEAPGNLLSTCTALPRTLSGDQRGPPWGTLLLL
jgi:hypothetical protein